MHRTMHIPPQAILMHKIGPSTNTKFPIYRALVHLDDTCHENGEIRFLEVHTKKVRRNTLLNLRMVNPYSSRP